MRAGGAAQHRVDAAAVGRIERVLFWATAAFGASLFWLARHPPMVDLPQHAGQIALMRDALFGPGHWAEVVRLNWFTPYLIGYLLALPLSLVAPIGVALQVLLSLSYLAFVAMCTVLRRHFDADPRLDWLALVPFFGLSYEWGFLTFLVAAPIALAMVLLSSVYAKRPTPGRGLAVVAAGLVLLASHGLQFLFGWLVAVALLVPGRANQRLRAAAFLPHVTLALLCGLYFLASRNVEADFNVPYGYTPHADYSLKRLLKFPLFAVGERWDVALLPLVGILLAVPWLYGLRPSRERAVGCIPFAVVAAIGLLVPSFALNTAFLYERFGLYVLPTYAWMFTAPRRATARTPAAWAACTAGLGAVAVCWAVLTVNAVRVWSFGRETSGIDQLIARLAPFEHALILVSHSDSRAANNPFAFIHYPAWYQAEHDGMVDFNFAWFPPQIVRFRPGHLPAWQPGLEWQPERFEWKTHHGADYRYFFVRTLGPVPPTLFAGAPCPPAPIWSGDLWTVFERRSCP